MHKLQQDMVDLYLDLRKDMPGLTTISFMIGDYFDGPSFCNYYHVGEDCTGFDTVEELIAVVEKHKAHRHNNELLFRRV
ncbi:hypothetical protein LCGC14_2022140 [marine sediment metagenome]|uniref:Uncharacterized protein n=1 Tax=marine sediment metagenome TaxID=412755 RepID=A0A0F9EXB3_9ZZZZ